MTFPKIQIVSSLESGRVLFDFNPGRGSIMRRWVSADEASPIGEPTWDTSPTGVVEGTRQIVVPLRDAGHSAEASMSVLSELLTRTTRLYLHWQVSPENEPVWFELIPSTAGGALDFSRVWWDDADSSTWMWKVTLTAKAFAIGARENLTPSTGLVQAGFVVNDPIEITDPIKGNVPAPLNLDIAGGNLSGWRCQLSSWAMDSAMTTFPYLSGDTSETWGTMTSGHHTMQYEAIMPGQYRALVYVERNSGSGSCRVQVGVENSVPSYQGSTAVTEITWAKGRSVTPKGASIGYWVDTGRLNIPFGVDPTKLPETVLNTMRFHVNIDTGGDTSTSWTLSRVTLIPVVSARSRAMQTSLAAAWGRYPETGGWMRVDSENRTVSSVQADDQFFLVPPPIVDGGFPHIFPGARNFLMFIPRINDVETSDRHGGWGDLAQSQMWYHPRYLHVGAR